MAGVHHRHRHLLHLAQRELVGALRVQLLLGDAVARRRGRADGVRGGGGAQVFKAGVVARDGRGAHGILGHGRLGKAAVVQGLVHEAVGRHGDAAVLAAGPPLPELRREAAAVEVALVAAVVRRLLVAERHHRRHTTLLGGGVIPHAGWRPGEARVRHVSEFHGVRHLHGAHLARRRGARHQRPWLRRARPQLHRRQERQLARLPAGHGLVGARSVGRRPGVHVVAHAHRLAHAQLGVLQRHGARGKVFVGGDGADGGQRVGHPSVAVGGDDAHVRRDGLVHWGLERVGGGGGRAHMHGGGGRPLHGAGARASCCYRRRTRVYRFSLSHSLSFSLVSTISRLP
mmetsp:Transcript_28802/g.71036  ORF Transcript_28802/g.71036 Transcript_28802/m.71036 type:complete len:343 (-) Transcript_28802:88-1116(-)